MAVMDQNKLNFWSIPIEELFAQLQAKIEGLTSEEARQRILRYGDNLLKPKKHNDVFTFLLAQFKSSIILIL